jgi:broad-specificity NMP kinase
MNFQDKCELVYKIILELEKPYIHKRLISRGTIESKIKDKVINITTEELNEFLKRLDEKGKIYCHCEPTMGIVSVKSINVNKY